MTEDEIRRFQESHYDWEGERLEPDGVLGPRTRWALAIARLDPRRQAIVARATACVGVTERGGTNRSKDIDAWLERCGAPLGSAWCAAFASWCISVAGLPTVKQAGAQALGRSMLATRAPVPGDVIWFKTGVWTGHCGIVVGVGPDEVATVEGNQRNAVRCLRRIRAEVNFARVVDVPTPPGLVVEIPPGLELVHVQSEGTR